MSWFNYYGLAIMAIIMIPNIIYAIKHKNDVAPTYTNKKIVIAEQIGRYGCFILMIFNIPYTYFNFWFDSALIVYLSVNGSLCLAYLIFWIICWRQNGKLKALSLSIIPSCIFLFSAIVLAYVPLIAFSILFASSHIFISYKNATQKNSRRKKPTIEDKIKDAFLLLFVILLFALAVIGTLFDSGTGKGAFPLN